MSIEYEVRNLNYNSTKNPEMTFSIPIFSIKDNAHIVGILVARINLDQSLYKLLLDRVGLGKTGETLIVNKDAIALNELRNYENAPLELMIEAEPAINAAAGKTGIIQGLDYRGKEVLAAYTYIQRTDWGFVCKQDMEELNVPIRRMIWQRVILFLITVILIFIVTFIISKSLAKPIVGMDRVAQKMREGDFSVRNTIESKDELGSLAQAFNTMIDAMQSGVKIQKGVADISGTVIEQSSLQDFGSELLKQLMKITAANMSTFYILNEAASEYKHFASVGANQALLKTFDAENPEGEFGNAIATKRIFYLRDIPDDSNFKFKTTAGELLPKEIITIPVLIEETVVALISLVNIYKFSTEAYEVLNQSWISINASYASLLSNERTRILAESLTRTNQQLETQSEELEQSSAELMEQNAELEMQAKQLNEASRLKTNFLSNMSHELRTPLNSVIALSGVLNRRLAKQIPDEEYSYLEVIERNGKNLLALINDILDISRIESGKEDVEISTFNIHSQITELVSMILPQAKQKKIELIQTNNDSEILLKNDAHKIRHIIQNMISNAVKFTEVGKVEVKAEKNEKNVVVTVTDTGIGIADENLLHIFDEFRQADGSTSRRFGGTGLGLAIAKKYANFLGGTITANSVLGEGSAFILTLPLIYTSENSIIAEEENTEIKYELKQNAPKMHSSIKTILLVEDSEPAIIQMKDILEENGYKIIVAHDGGEALAIIANTIPDAILLDLMMPGVDGFDVLKSVRNEEKTAHIPVLILTAKHITKEELKFLKRNNVHQLIQKGDISRTDLLTAISTMVFSKKVEEKKPKRALQIINDKPVVLVVEDNADNMLTVKALFANNYMVIEASDGNEGIEMAIKHKPNLILMDIAMPGIDGIEAFKVIRNHVELQNIPVIALTASAMIHDRETILSHGFDSYIPKPIEEKMFFKIINELLYGK
jgi:signal transduction histidine kinase/DNA-binding response OmpR family regulator/HAMP domain-containing protein